LSARDGLSRILLTLDQWLASLVARFRSRLIRLAERLAERGSAGSTPALPPVTPAVGRTMRAALPEAELRQKIASRPFWYHQIELAPGVVAPGMNDCRLTLQHLQLPASLEGRRVLDLGAAEGYFTFECEGRGAAELLAVDYSTPEHTGFRMCAELLGSRARHLYSTLYDLTPEQIGQFDVVLFLGILYHLPDPLLALNIVRRLCRPSALVFVETYVTEAALLRPDGVWVPLRPEVREALDEVPLMQFFVGDSLNRDDFTNFWGPNVAGVRWLLAEGGFEVLSYSRPMGNRAVFNCRAAEPPSRHPLVRQAYGRWLADGGGPAASPKSAA